MKSLKSIFLLLLTICCCSNCKHETTSKTESSIVENIKIQNGHVNLYIKGLCEPFNILFLSDSHITIEDERGKPFYDYTRRMGGEAVEPQNYGKTNGREKAFIASLEEAKKEKAELVILGGDIINFPSLASVEFIKSIMDKSGLNWVYTAGNHDWHYEGEPGKSLSLREKWTTTNLKPLYQGENPMYRSQIIKGINFVTLDNSDYEISEEQLSFMEKQIKTGIPILLSIHIPIYVKGHEKDIDYGCGNPNWNKAHDYNYKIERREPWPEKGLSKTTFKFRDLVANNPIVFAILSGHTHVECVDYFNGKIQYVAGANHKNKDIKVHLIPAN